MWWAIDQMRLKSFNQGKLSNVNRRQNIEKYILLKTRFCIWSSSRPRKGPREVSPPDQSLPRRPEAEAQSDLLNLSPSGERARETGSDFWALSSASRNLRPDLPNCFGAQPLPARLKTSLNTLYMTFIIRMKWSMVWSFTIQCQCQHTWENSSSYWF